MIKLLLTGVWACAVSLGAVFGVLEWQKSKAAQASGEEEVVIQELKTRAINVPIIGDGYIQGYVIAQFAFTVDAAAVQKLPVDPQGFLLDEAFKTIYAGEKIDFKNLKKQDLPALAKMLGENVNKRLGAPVVQDVLLEQLSYVPKSDMRGPPKK